MGFNAIDSKAAYKATLKEISELVDLDPDVGTPEGNRLNTLVALVQEYEAKHTPVGAPDSV